MMDKRRPRRVALAFPSSVPWMACCLQGIEDYARQHGDWLLMTSPPTLTGAEELALSAYALKDWPGSGVIAAIGNPDEARAARRLTIPVVNLAAAYRDYGLPRVMVDHVAVGRLAAEHLLSRGLRQLAFFGLEDVWYSDQRRRGFVERAREAGIACEVFEAAVPTNPKLSWRQRNASLVRWLKTLVLPIGILAVHDYRARVLVDECLDLGLRVPLDVAVVGVDNDTTICELCQPAISSVSRSAYRVGYEAAAMLDRLMAGQPVPRQDLLIEPDGVVARRSTDTIVVENPHLRDAIQWMHDHLGESIDVERAVRQVDISRRLLEKLFRKHLGCTPREYLNRMRVERAKQLLAATKKTKVREVVLACGFGDAKRFRLIFRRFTGMLPSEFRRRAAGRRKGEAGSPEA